jgi:hypothetical protein
MKPTKEQKEKAEALGIDLDIKNPLLLEAYLLELDKVWLNPETKKWEPK